MPTDPSRDARWTLECARRELASAQAIKRSGQERLERGQRLEARALSDIEAAETKIAELTQGCEMIVGKL